MPDTQCAFCELLQGCKDSIADINDERKKENEADIIEDYTVVLLIRSHIKGMKKKPGMLLRYWKKDIGYKLNFCPECGKKL